MISGFIGKALAPIWGALLVLGIVGFAPAPVQAETMKVAGIFETPIEEPWVKQIHQALLKGKEELDIDYTYSESVKSSDFGRVMREYAEQGYQLIMGDAFGAERGQRERFGNPVEQVDLVWQGCGVRFHFERVERTAVHGDESERAQLIIHADEPQIGRSVAQLSLLACFRHVAGAPFVVAADH